MTFRSVADRARGIDPRLIGVAAIALAASGLLLLNSWEINGETWSYWLWSKVFADSGEFVVIDRSPFYILYLNAYRWIGYPSSVAVEYYVSGLVVIAAIVTLFRRYLGLGMALFVALLWLPFLQGAEPPVQKLGLAFSLWALHLRISGAGSRRMAASYGLFGLAAMFRTTFLGVIVLFVAWDIYRAFRNGGLRGLVPGGKTLRALAVPVVLLVGLQVWFISNQSPHMWNNVWSTTTTWFPLSNPKSLSESFVIHHFNWKYIETKYGTFENHDWYFTNQEVFDGETTALGAIRANPGFIVRQLLRNIKPAIFTSAKFMELRYLPLLRVYDSLALIIIFVGAFLAVKNPSVRLFVIASILMYAVSVAFLPGKYRHFVPLVPALVFGAIYLGSRLRDIMSAESSVPARWLVRVGLFGVALTTAYIPLRIAFAPQTATRLTYAGLSAYGIALFLVAVGAYRLRSKGGEPHSVYGRVLWVAAMVVPLILLSNGATSWINLAQGVAADVGRGDIRVLEQREVPSMRASYDELYPILQGCKGVMALEHGFVAAFLDIPLDNVHDVYEIPPFGRLGDSEYDGLRPDRIDCVLVSDRLATGIGSGTNFQIRYQNYIAPYVEQLKEMGATTYDIDTFGQAVVLGAQQGRPISNKGR